MSSPDPSLFDWFAEIWIPLFVGIATVVVSAAALIASSRATRIAREVEKQRLRAGDERAQEARRERLQTMAQAEARALHRYVTEAVKPMFWNLRAMRDPDVSQSPLERARIEARVMLQQSIVPGADALLRLTEFDLTHRAEYLPDELTSQNEVGDDIPDEAREEVRRSLVAARDRRTLGRIRDWALDPESTESDLNSDLERAITDAENYLKIGLA